MKFYTIDTVPENTQVLFFNQTNGEFRLGKKCLDNNKKIHFQYSAENAAYSIFNFLSPKRWVATHWSPLIYEQEEGTSKDRIAFEILKIYIKNAPENDPKELAKRAYEMTEALLQAKLEYKQ